MVALIAALSREARAVRAGLARSGVEGIAVRRGGVGPERARAAAEQLLSHGATSLVSVGVAGGLDPAVRPGTIVIPDAVRTEQARFATAVDLSDAMRAALTGRLPLARGSLFGSDRVLGEITQKRALGRRFDSVAVDMESAAVCAAAIAAGRPAAVLRVVADAADDPIPPLAIELMNAPGKTSAGALLSRFWRRPGELRSLLRLRRRYALACEALERALALCAPALGDPGG